MAGKDQKSLKLAWSPSCGYGEQWGGVPHSISLLGCCLPSSFQDGLCLPSYRPGPASGIYPAQPVNLKSDAFVQDKWPQG